MIRALFVGLFFSVSLTAFAQNLPDFSDLAEKEGAAVVNISTTHIMHQNGMFNIPENDPFYEFFRRFAPQAPRDIETKSLGSGFIISSDGYILTNAHVVDSAEEVTVKLTDKREFHAKVVGADKRTDVALIKIEASNLPKVTQGDPAKLKVGEWVVAIGSPFGFDNTVTAGIVSAKGRALNQENFVPFIQTDVAINPGNSGGPLFNMKGEVVGINSQIYSRTGGFMGLSFAIPMDVAMEVATQLKSTGHVIRGRIGVTIQAISPELAESFGLSDAKGALVSAVEKNGAADKAGISPADIILKFDGKTINSSSDLPKIVASTKPGTKVPVEIWRKGAARKLQVVVGETPEEKLFLPASKSHPNRLGLALRPLSPEEKNALQTDHGLVVEDVGEAIAAIRRGDVILAINNQNVDSVEEFNRLLGQYEKGKSVAFLIRRGAETTFVTMKLNGK